MNDKRTVEAGWLVGTRKESRISEVKKFLFKKDDWKESNASYCTNVNGTGAFWREKEGAIFQAKWKFIWVLKHRCGFRKRRTEITLEEGGTSEVKNATNVTPRSIKASTIQIQKTCTQELTQIILIRRRRTNLKDI